VAGVPALATLAAVPIVLALALGAGWALRRGVDPALYVLANLIFFTDALDLGARVWMRRRYASRSGLGPGPTSVPLNIGQFTPFQMKVHQRPYALVCSMHNAEDILDDFLEGLGPYRDRLWVIDDASTDQTWFKLQQAGVQAVRASRNRKKPGAIRELLALLPPDIATVVVLDPDVRIGEAGDGISALDRVVFEFQRTGAAALSPRLTIRPDGWLARVQEFEYATAFGLGRMSLADHSITSGVALYRRDALAGVLDEHSLSVYAEDLENALILLGRGERVYYDERLVAQTEGKRTWSEWFSQRVGWSYGLVKVYVERIDEIWRGSRARLGLRYQYLVYMGLFTLPLQPVRIVTLVLLSLSTANGLDLLLGLDLIPDVAATDPAYFLFAYLKYTGLVLVASTLVGATPHDWLRLVPVVPVYFFYALAHVVPVTVGYANWLSLRVAGVRLYRDHYQDEDSLREERRSATGNGDGDAGARP
jgi:hypothetical protein